jgi:phosphoglycerate dehydrogenase-like enzyme
MKTNVYVSEPDVININQVRQLLGEKYQLILGDTAFSGQALNCAVLLMRSATIVTASIKDAFPHLTDIVRIGTGVDNIDMEFCTKEHIAVHAAPGANADAVSDYVVCMMLVALRKIHTLTEHDVETWNRFKFVGHSMSSQSIGIVGFGNIGRRIYHKLQGFSCKNFYVYDPYVKKDDLPAGVQHMSSVDELLAKSTIVTLHLPLMPETRGIINTRNLVLLAEGSILLNSSRGGIVNEADVVAAAKGRGLVYVADTVENEPAVSSILLREDAVVVTPHIASLTEEAEYAMVELAIDNFLHRK